jgi:hypothetical protein
VPEAAITLLFLERETGVGVHLRVISGTVAIASLGVELSQDELLKCLGEAPSNVFVYGPTPSIPSHA